MNNFLFIPKKKKSFVSSYIQSKYAYNLSKSCIHTKEKPFVLEVCNKGFLAEPRATLIAYEQIKQKIIFYKTILHFYFSKACHLWRQYLKNLKLTGQSLHRKEKPFVSEIPVSYEESILKKVNWTQDVFIWKRNPLFVRYAVKFLQLGQEKYLLFLKCLISKTVLIF